MIRYYEFSRGRLGRNDIVHAGKSITEPVCKAKNARKLLKELLILRLNETFGGFTDDNIPNRNEYGLRTNPEEWLPVVFEHDDSLELTTEEIKARAFAIYRDFNRPTCSNS